MNEQEMGIINDSIESIKTLVNLTMEQVSKNDYTTEKKYKLFRYILELGEDTIEELRKILDGHYRKPTEDLCCKGE